MTGDIHIVGYDSQVAVDYGMPAGEPEQDGSNARVSAAIILVGSVPCQISQEESGKSQHNKLVDMQGAEDLSRYNHGPE
jgi:hypothetical protein